MFTIKDINTDTRYMYCGQKYKLINDVIFVLRENDDWCRSTNINPKEFISAVIKLANKPKTIQDIARKHSKLI